MLVCCVGVMVETAVVVSAILLALWLTFRALKWACCGGRFSAGISCRPRLGPGLCTVSLPALCCKVLVPVAESVAASPSGSGER